MADVLRLEGSGLTDRVYSFALKAHFDFVVTNEQHMPLFAVEFDGPSHASSVQVSRDKIKNHLCATAGLPLLRVRSAHLHRAYDGWDLLSWFVDVWFMQEEADRMYAEGRLPYDFDFDPAMILYSPDHSRRFPYWLGLEAQIRIQQLHSTGTVLDPVASMCDGVDASGVHRGLAFVRIDRHFAAYVEVQMRAQLFPVGLDEPVRGVLLNDVRKQLERTLSGHAAPVSLSLIDQKISELKKRCGSLASSLYGPPPQPKLA